MKTIELDDARDSLGDYARNLGSEPLLVTQGGQTVAALMPVLDNDLDSLALASNPQFLAILERARAQRRAGLALTPDDVRRELGIARRDPT
jgi:hypothetical protein